MGRWAEFPHWKRQRNPLSFCPMQIALMVWIGPCLLANCLAQTTAPAKKLIEFGWDEPDSAFLRQHIAEMERMPFDGCVFHVNYLKPDGNRGKFTWECWGRRAFTEACHQVPRRHHLVTSRWQSPALSQTHECSPMEPSRLSGGAAMKPAA